MSRHSAALALLEIRARRALLARRPRRRQRLPKQLPPSATIIAYRAELLALLRDAQALLRERLFPLLGSLLKEAALARGDSLRLDAGGRRIKELIEQVRSEWSRRHPASQLTELAARMGARISRQQREQLQRQVRAGVGVDVLSAEPNVTPLVDDFTQKQVSLITNASSTLLSQVEERVQTAVLGGWRAEDLALELQRRFAVGESRAELIARDQTLTFFSNLNEVRQKAMGVSHYRWQTSQDERVRAEHARRNGKRYAWATSDIVPGEEVNCRCTAEPDLDALLEAL